jgi:hypothetical protein
MGTSPNYFKSRIGKYFFGGIHFIIPPTTSSTKKIILWNMEELEKWLQSKISSNDLEIALLLNRKK